MTTASSTFQKKNKKRESEQKDHVSLVREVERERERESCWKNEKKAKKKE